MPTPVEIGLTEVEPVTFETIDGYWKGPPQLES